jgi:two-component system chemotaxis sensor kinase CheA
VLGLIRSEKLVPNPDIINVLLLAADELQHLIEDVANSNSVDISSHTAALNAIFEGGEAPASVPRTSQEKIVSETDASIAAQHEAPITEPLFSAPPPEEPIEEITAEEEGVLDQEIDQTEDSVAESGRGTRARGSSSTPKNRHQHRVTVSLLDQ